MTPNQSSRSPGTRHVRPSPRNPFATWLLLGVAFVMSACSSVDTRVYQAETPKLTLEQYFNGPVKAWGMFQDRSGQVVRRFTVDMKGTWTGDTGVLEEDFSYSDGTKDRRVWTIRKHPDGRYTGKAADVIGEADGRADGNALNWHYTLALPVGDSVYNVKLDDWMYLIDESVMINRARMSKFGIYLGEVTITFNRPRSN